MSEDSIFSEIDEELRSERMRNLWRRFGPYIIGGAVAIVVLVAVNEGWSWWQRTSAAQSSDRFYAAIDLAEQGDIAAAQAALETLAAEGSGQYPVLARFRQAALLAEDGKKAEAVAAYDALSTSLSNRRLRELSLLFGAYLLVDEGGVNAVQSRIEGLITPDNPLRNSAREALGLAHYAAGERDAARAIFEEIAADPTGSYEAQSRVQMYLAQVISEGAMAPGEEAAAEDAAGAAAE